MYICDTQRPPVASRQIPPEFEEQLQRRKEYCLCKYGTRSEPYQTRARAEGASNVSAVINEQSGDSTTRQTRSQTRMSRNQDGTHTKSRQDRSQNGSRNVRGGRTNSQIA